MRAATPSGRWIKAPGGYEAFHPNDLPPQFGWSPALARALSDADLRLGRLAGEGRALVSPHVLLRPFIRREAVYSSRIEGTQATLGELLAAEAGVAVDRSPDDLREVGNYVTALEFGIERLRDLPLSLRLVKELHAKLMRRVRGEHATPGEFRKSQNWIGPPGSTLADASYVPPPHHEMVDYLGRWENFLHDRSLPPLVQAALMHYQFEAIHPFLDGNGRVGRLLITLFLVEREILPTPLLYLSAFFEATRRDYYQGLLGVTERGEWEAWLHYFFNGVARQSEDALSRTERINKLLASWRGKLAGGGSKVPLLILEMATANPYLTARGVEKKLRVAYNTALRGIQNLAQAKILKEISGGKRDRVFCAKALLDILEEPARLTPMEKT